MGVKEHDFSLALKMLCIFFPFLELMPQRRKEFFHLDISFADFLD